MKRIMFGMLVLTLTVFSVIGCSGGRDAEEETIVLKLGHGTSTDSLYHAGSQKFKKLVEKKSKGKIKVEIYSDGKLGHDNDLLEGMKMGTVQMGMIGVEPLTTIEPKLKAINLPYVFDDRQSTYKVLDGEIGKEMVADLPEKQGIRVLGFFENGFRNITNSKRAIHSPEDLQGLKIRTPQSPVSIAIFKALGGNPTPMSFGELYTALEQGTIDGQENPLSLIYSSKLYEVQKHITLTRHIYSPMVLTISENTWSELSPELQKVVLESANEAKNYERKLSVKQEEELLKKLEQKGVKIIRPDLEEFKQATKDVHLQFDSDYGSDFYKRLKQAASK